MANPNFKREIYEEMLWKAIHFEWSLYHRFPLIAIGGLALGKQLKWLAECATKSIHWWPSLLLFGDF